jgi:hypothetical protein
LRFFGKRLELVLVAVVGRDTSAGVDGCASGTLDLD